MKTLPTAVIGCGLIWLCGCAQLKPSVYLGGQSVTPLRDYRPDENSASIYVNAIWSIGKNWSFQVEPIVPVTRPGEPLLRVAIDRKLF